MNDRQFLPASMLASCQFGMVALFALMIAGLWVGSVAAAFLAVLALGASYAAQSCFTWCAQIGAGPIATRLWWAGVVLQGAACLAWLIGLACLVPALIG